MEPILAGRERPHGELAFRLEGGQGRRVSPSGDLVIPYRTTVLGIPRRRLIRPETGFASTPIGAAGKSAREENQRAYRITATDTIQRRIAPARGLSRTIDSSGLPPWPF
jgi:hypothetical protein